MPFGFFCLERFVDRYGGLLRKSVWFVLKMRLSYRQQWIYDLMEGELNNILKWSHRLFELE